MEVILAKTGQLFVFYFLKPNSMKKLVIIASLFIVALATKVTAQESMTIKNGTQCTIKVVLYAHDNGCLSTSCGSWVSNMIVLAPLSVVTYNAEPGVSDPMSCTPGAGPGWNNGCYSPACMPMAGGWDGADVHGGFGTISFGPGACQGGTTSGNSGAGTDCMGNTVYVNWTVSMGQIFLVAHY